MANILLVEDEAEVREMLVDELSTQGHTVSEAEDGAEGLKKLLALQPDLVICDRAMSVMSGYELLERIRTMHPEFNGVPFIFLSALTDQRDREAVEHLRPAAYIGKPVDFGVLNDKIRALVKKK